MMESHTTPYLRGHFLGSGQGEEFLAEAGLDRESQFKAIKPYLQTQRSPERLPTATCPSTCRADHGLDSSGPSD